MIGFENGYIPKVIPRLAVPQPILGSVRNSSLFLSWIKPHQPVSSASVARWLKTDTSVFKAHSIRGGSVLQIQVWSHLSPPWFPR